MNDKWGYKRVGLLRWEWWFYGDSHYFYYGLARTRRSAKKQVVRVGNTYFEHAAH